MAAQAQAQADQGSDQQQQQQQQGQQQQQQQGQQQQQQGGEQQGQQDDQKDDKNGFKSVHDIPYREVPQLDPTGERGQRTVAQQKKQNELVKSNRRALGE